MSFAAQPSLCFRWYSVSSSKSCSSQLLVKSSFSPQIYVIVGNIRRLMINY